MLKARIMKVQHNPASTRPAFAGDNAADFANLSNWFTILQEQTRRLVKQPLG
jgi:hypothetical protein